jgi:hypothetical protein
MALVIVGKVGAAGVLVMLLCVATASAGFWPGEPTFVDAEIAFFYEDSGMPIGIDDAVIVESMNGSVLITERIKTDEEGKIKLHGIYCLPMAVGVVGGFADVHVEYLESHYVVAVKRRLVDHDKELGWPNAFNGKNITEIRKTCRF